MFKTLFKELYADLIKKIGQEKTDIIANLGATMEDGLKMSSTDILKLDDISQFEFPVESDGFRRLLGNLRSVVEKTGNKETAETIENITKLLPEYVEADAAVSPYDWHTVSDEAPGKTDRNPSDPNIRPENEPNLDALIKVVNDFITMNEYDREFDDELDAIIDFYSNKIRMNESPEEAPENRNLTVSKIKLGAYFNLYNENKFGIICPDILVSGNRAIIEIGLYNSFLKTLAGLTDGWRHKIFQNIDKDIVNKRSQFDIIYKAVAACIKELFVSKTTRFLEWCSSTQGDMMKEKCILSEQELGALEELYSTHLGKSLPEAVTLLRK